MIKNYIIKRFSFSKAKVALVTTALLSTSTGNVLAMDIQEEKTRNIKVVHKVGNQTVEKGRTVLGGLLYRGPNRSRTVGGETTIEVNERNNRRITIPQAALEDTSNNHQFPPLPPSQNRFPGTGHRLGENPNLKRFQISGQQDYQDYELEVAKKMSLISLDKERKEQQIALDSKIAEQLSISSEVY